MESIENLRELLKGCGCSDQCYSCGINYHGSIADEIEREIAEKYQLLPVDADGVPIRCGDVMCSAGIREKGHKVIVSAIFEDGFVEYGNDNGLIGPLCQEDWVHIKPRTLDDIITEYEELAANQNVKDYFEVSKELRTIQSEQFMDEPELELYKEFNGYRFYIELPYDELWIMTDRVEVKHHSYSYRYERPNGSKVMSCSSLCGYPREWAIERLDEEIEEIRELMEARDD